MDCLDSWAGAALSVRSRNSSAAQACRCSGFAFDRVSHARAVAPQGRRHRAHRCGRRGDLHALRAGPPPPSRDLQRLRTGRRRGLRRRRAVCRIAARAPRIRARWTLDGVFRTVPLVPIKQIVAVVVILAAATGCSHTLRQAQGDIRQAQGDAGKIRVATTISTLNSFVQGVGGEYVTVTNIVPVGASPETFRRRRKTSRSLPMRSCWSKMVRAWKRGSTACCTTPDLTSFKLSSAAKACR